MASKNLINVDLLVFIEEYLCHDGVHHTDAFMEQFEDAIQENGGRYRTLLHIFLRETDGLAPMQKAAGCVKHFQDYLRMKQSCLDNLDVSDESGDDYLDDDSDDEIYVW